MIRSGVVKFFNNDKLWGFIIDDKTSEDIFFHYNDREYLWPGKEDPVFSGMNSKFDRKKQKWVTLNWPRKKDRIVYYLVKAQDKFKAMPWCFENKYKDIEKIISDRGPLPKYRILKQHKMWTTNTVIEEPECLWQGDDLDELLKKFPIERMGRDCLRIKNFTHNDGFQTKIWFEKINEAGIWSECDDPREEAQKKLIIRQENWRKV